MASSSRKKSAAGKSKSGGARKAPQKQPIRREVGAGVLFVLTLCVLVSYFGINALFIDWLAKLIKGLFGYGYWIAGPSLLIAGMILLFHRGRPVQLRVTCSLLLPVLFGSLVHMAFCKEIYEPSFFTMLSSIWGDGIALKSGGAISGVLANACVAVFSKLASVILFTVLFVVLLLIALRLALALLAEKHRQRVPYEYDEEEPSRASIHVTQTDPPKRRTAAKPQIDIPLDGEEPPKPQKKEPGRFTSFFKHKSDQQRTPDEVLLAPMPEPSIPEPPPKKPERSASIPAPAEPAAKIPVPQHDPWFPPAPKPEVVWPPAPKTDGTEYDIPELPTPEPSIPVAVTEQEPEPEPTPIPEPEPAPAPEPRIIIPEPASLRGSKAETAREVAKQTAEVEAEIRQKLASSDGDYQFPTITLLKENRGENHIEAGAELRNNSRRLAETLASFNVDATPGDVIHGPSITRYEFVLSRGVKLSKITNLSDDIALALGAAGVRIAPVPDKSSVVGIEVPNKQVTPVLIRDVIESREFIEHPSQTAFALGRDIGGRNIVGDINALPHVLIAGTTGSGKSVCTNSLIISLLYKSTPEEVRFIMVDPKQVELAPYNGIPHLLIPVVTDAKKAAGALQWAVYEMNKRYSTFKELSVKKLEEYNRIADSREDMEHMPAIVVVIDELADLMIVAGKEVEDSIYRVAQMGRAAGIHLVIATQRPSTDVITGVIKGNIPSRIAFAVASSIDSRIILDETGAEKLVGRGDMLYAPLGAGRHTRVQGCFISPEEIDRVVAFVKQSGETHYSDEVIAKIEESVQEKGGGSKNPAAESDKEPHDELLDAAVEVILEAGSASVSMLMRRLRIHYNRAGRLIDQLEQKGYIGPYVGSKARDVLITRAQWQEMQMGSREEIDPPNEEESL